VTDLVVLALVALTSAVAGWLGVRRLGLPGRALGTAAGRLLECVGLAVLFFAANAAAGVLAILAARGLTGRFVSLYLVGDPVLLGLSWLQAVLFAWWRAASGRSRPSSGP
jgi:hypothetical protein